ncbi:TorF family putative porin [Solilutibacter pythonis]|nr:TorF family putative porin [Lysobacter pythonis]
MRVSSLGLALSLSLLAAPALAQEVGPEVGREAAWTLGGGVTGVSDYVWRGISQTRGKPALQFDLNLSHRSGFHAGVWASNVDFTATGDENDGIRYELDPYIGWSGEVFGNGSELELSLSRVTYPRAKPGFNVNYTEIEGKLTFPQHVYVGLAYSPDIFKLGARGIYYNAGVDLPLGESGWGLKAQAGHYDLKKAAGDSYDDLLLGVNRQFGPVKAELAWTDTTSYGEALSENLDEASQAGARWVLSLGWEF